MPIPADQARLIAGYLLDQFEQEVSTTKAVLAALPAGKEDYSPDPRSTPALKLAWHIASADQWFLNSILAGRFEAGDPGGIPQAIRTGADAAAWYEANVAAAIAALRAAPAETFSRALDFFGKMQAQGADFLALALKHSIHHRGQLSAYLRPAGGKVPGIYGPSGEQG